jgi:hypothetical protein
VRKRLFNLLALASLIVGMSIAIYSAWAALCGRTWELVYLPNKNAHGVYHQCFVLLTPRRLEVRWGWQDYPQAPRLPIYGHAFVPTGSTSRLIFSSREPSYLGFSFYRFDFNFPNHPIPNGWFGLAIPLWFPLLCCVVAPAIWFRKRRHLPPLPGHCRKCGYDLRATPDRCPECGTLQQTPVAAHIHSGVAHRLFNLLAGVSLIMCALCAVAHIRMMMMMFQYPLPVQVLPIATGCFAFLPLIWLLLWRRYCQMSWMTAEFKRRVLFHL